MLTYLYKVTQSDPIAQHMIVEYTTEGFDPILVGVPIPTATDSLDDVLRAYAPIQAWTTVDTELQNVVVGTSGVLTHGAPAEATPAISSPDVAEVTSPIEQAIVAVLMKHGLLTQPSVDAIAQ